MDAGSNDYTNNQFRIRLRAPTKPSGENLDRFIPNRSAMNFDYADYALTKRMKGKENQVVVCSPSRQAYRKRLAEALDMNYSRILAFKNKPAAVIDPIPKEFFSRSAQQSKPTKSQRCIPKTPKMILRAPQILDDFYLNLMDWGSANVLAVALSDAVYLWNATNATVSELVTVDAEDAPVSCVSWAPDGCHIAIGLRNSHVQIWDATATKLLRTIRWGHQSQVNALAWNHQLLTTGGIDGKIINNDVRVREHVVETYKGHQQEVCGLKWSASGRQLASGGSDNLVLIWDRCMTPSNSARQWVHRLEEHTSAIKALAWCPFQGNLLASGGGVDDRCIKFWNTATGICLKSVDTGSQVCSLLWSKHERELCSSHGFTQNQLTLWEYPSMVKMAELTGHTSRVLFADQSPDGYTVATAAGDETVRFWNVFGPVLKAKSEPFAHLSSIR